MKCVSPRKVSVTGFSGPERRATVPVSAAPHTAREIVAGSSMRPGPRVASSPAQSRPVSSGSSPMRTAAGRLRAQLLGQRLRQGLEARDMGDRGVDGARLLLEAGQRLGALQPRGGRARRGLGAGETQAGRDALGALGGGEVFLQPAAQVGEDADARAHAAPPFRRPSASGFHCARNVPPFCGAGKSRVCVHARPAIRSARAARLAPIR